MSLGKRLFIGEAAAADGACSTDSLHPFENESAYSSNVALYEFENNANDTVGNHNASSSSDFSTDSKFGTYSFDITSSSVFDTGISNSELPVNGGWTCSAWVKPTGFSTNRAPISFTSWTTNYGWSLWVSTSGIAYPRVGTSLQGSGFSLTLNNWHHIVLTYDSSVLKFYVDKTLISQHTVTINAPNTNLRFGKSNLIFPTGNFGKLDQVRMYDKALSSDEVGILYNETTSTASDTNVLNEGSGVALYSLDYDASDAGGNYDGIVTHSAYGVLPSFGVDGQINSGARFYGSPTKSHFSTGITINDLSMTNTSFSCWVNLTATSSGTIMDNGGAVSFRTGLVLETASGYIVWQQANGANGQATAITSASNSYNDGNWHHVVGTIDSNRVMKLYIDGNVESSTPTANVENHSHPDFELVVGTRSGYFSNYYEGLLDQVRIFKKALSQSEVDTLYGETACVYTSTTDTVDYQGTNVAYYKLDNNAEDAKGNYDGTATNVNYEFGRFGQAAVFNGSSSKITVPDSGDNLNFSNHIGTISAWVNLDSISGGEEPIVSKRGSGSPGARSYIVNVTNGVINWYTYNTDSNAQQVSSTSTISANMWYHIAVTLDQTNIKIYIDGILDKTASSTYTSIQDDSADFAIGYRGSNSGFVYADGSIDQVRIFDSALDATAVENLYNEKPEADTSNFKTVLYQGNNGSRYVSNIGFQPDLVWVKRRDTTMNAVIFDSVRTVGSNKELTPAENYTEGGGNSGSFGYISSLESNGFILTSGSTNSNLTNATSGSYVAWCWKGGGDAALNEQGTIDSQVSANQDAGFSIVKYTGNSTAGATIGHGLSSPPDLIIAKGLETASAYNWMVYASPATTSLGKTAEHGHAYLNLTNLYEEPTNSSVKSIWNDTAPTSTVFSVADNVNINANGAYIAYCFHSVDGYQKIGSYTGNNTTNVVNTGFQPRFVMIKKTSGTGAWFMHDSLRLGTHGYSDKYLQANEPAQEADSSDNDLLEFTSTGFTLRTTFGDYNQLNGTYIYLAIA